MFTCELVSFLHVVYWRILKIAVFCHVFSTVVVIIYFSSIASKLHLQKMFDLKQIIKNK